MPMIEISEDAMSYMKQKARPLEDTTLSVMDRMVAELRETGSAIGTTMSEPEMRFGSDDFPSVQFTTITSGSVAGVTVKQKYWNNILEEMIAACADKVDSGERISEKMIGNVLPGKNIDNGYRYVESAGFSFQGMEAKRACRNIAILAEAFDVPVDIAFRWQDNERAQFPNRIARVVLP